MSEPELFAFIQWKLDNEIWVEIDTCRCLGGSQCDCIPMSKAYVPMTNKFAFGKDDMEACFNLAKKYRIIWFQMGKVEV